jgi:hypothetical protein
MYKFELDELEIEKFQSWKKNQKEKNPAFPTAGERWTFMFTPTGLGTIIQVKDNETDEILDLTDWDNF